MYPFLLESLVGDKILIPMYGLLLATAFSLSYIQSILGALQRGLDPRHIENLFLIIVLSAVVGSRGFHVLFENFDYFRTHPIEIFFLWQGGFTFYGALLLSMATSVTYALRHKLSVRKYSDVAAVAILLGLAVGRIGCFLAGCCWGSPTDLPWGVAFNHPHTFASPRGVPLHPTQIYESVLCWGIYFYLRNLSRHQKYDGQAAVHAMALYAAARIFVEIFRGDAYRGFVAGGYLSTSQFISLCLICIAWGLARVWNPQHKPTRH